MKKIIFVATILGAITLSNTSFAQSRITQHQKQQHHRIQQGKHSGELTKKEAKHLHNQQRMIQHDKKIAMADGHISHGERTIINREQQHADRSIYRMKHNTKRR
jgi:uncharacterized tellurite resistance protein B-like protein